ncbi:MAG: hypothetical protein N0C90_12990 [Candidatus Thiodiazotropha endolucinida]|nr:hypothetical protein [Candidatus Thiodiazotropha taylori]MCW4262277.1 hypothetical protein [Candidatus Thiodiazotropha endolucinida]
MRRKPSKSRIHVVGINGKNRNKIYKHREEFKAKFSSRWNPKNKVWWVDIAEADALKDYLREHEIHAELLSEYDYTGILLAPEDGSNGNQLADIAKEMGISFKKAIFLKDIITRNPDREWKVKRKHTVNEVAS